MYFFGKYTGIGENKLGFWGNTEVLGANTVVFGANTIVFGANTILFGANTVVCWANTVVFLLVLYCHLYIKR